MRYTEYHNGIAVIKDKIWIKNAMRQLAKWEDLKECGKLVELPCRPGDEIYVITNSGLIKRKVIAISFTKKGTQIITEDKRGDVPFCYATEFGRTIFMDKEVALFIWNRLQELV